MGSLEFDQLLFGDANGGDARDGPWRYPFAYEPGAGLALIVGNEARSAISISVLDAGFHRLIGSKTCESAEMIVSVAMAVPVVD